MPRLRRVSTANNRVRILQFLSTSNLSLKDASLYLGIPYATLRKHVSVLRSKGAFNTGSIYYSKEHTAGLKSFKKMQGDASKQRVFNYLFNAAKEAIYLGNINPIIIKEIVIATKIKANRVALIIEEFLKANPNLEKYLKVPKR